MLELKNKQIFVAGGSGFIGSYVIRALLKRGVPEKHIFAPSSKECDLRKGDDCRRAVKGMDVVFDCAGNPRNILSRGQMPAEIFHEILIMGLELLRAAHEEKVQKVITVGSVVEYPAGARMPLREEMLWSGLPQDTSIPYGFSKRIIGLQGELYRRQSGFNAIHVILTNCYGPGEKFSSGYMVPSLIKKIMDAKKSGQREIEAWGTGKATRDLLYAEDAAEGILRAAEFYDEALPLHLGSGEEISLRELTAVLCSQIGFDGAVRWDTTKPEGELRRVLDISRARSMIEFKPTTVLQEGFRKTVDWHATNPQ